MIQCIAGSMHSALSRDTKTLVNLAYKASLQKGSERQHDYMKRAMKYTWPCVNNFKQRKAVYKDQI